MSAIEQDYDALIHFYRLHARFYDVTRAAVLTGRARAVDRLRLARGERVVEIGCGTGHNFARIMDRVGAGGRLIGVDLSAEMLDVAQRRVTKRGWQNVELVRCRAEAFEILQRVEAVLCTYSLTMIPDWHAVLERIDALLAPGGRLVVTDFQVGPSWPPWARRAFTGYMNYHNVHPERKIPDALGEWFEVVSVQRAPWLHHFTASCRRR